VGLKELGNSLKGLSHIFDETFDRGETGPLRPPYLLTLDEYFITGDETEENEEVALITSKDRIRSEAREFLPCNESVPIVAVDAHTHKIARMTDGKNLIYACKVALIIESEGDFNGISETFVYRLNTDYEWMTWFYNSIILQRILGHGEVDRKPPTDHSKLADRSRNAVERYAQLLVASHFKNVISVHDGALISQTIDLPKGVLSNIISVAHSNGINVLAITKHSGLRTRDGEIIQNLLNGVEGSCYIDVHKYIKASYKKRLKGRVHVVKFSDIPIAPSFRVDISPSEGLSCGDVLDCFFSNAKFRMTKTYPEALFLAHVYAKFTDVEILDLLCLLASNFELTIESNLDLREAILKL